MALPNRSMKTLALLAALTALMGVVATGCGTSDDDVKKDDKTEEPAAEDGEATEEGTEGEDASGDEAADETGDEAADESGDEAAEDEAPAEDDEDA